MKVNRFVSVLSAICVCGVSPLFALDDGARPVTPSPSPEAVELLRYLYSISGKSTLAGQHCIPHVGSKRLPGVYKQTRKYYPAVFGQDFGFSQPGTSVPASRPFYIFPAAEYEGLLCSFNEILLSLEKDYFEAHGFNFATPSARKALQLLVDLVRKYKVTPEAVTSMTEVSSYEYFIRHDGLFLRGWTIYGKDFPDSSDHKQFIKMAPLPHFEDGELASTIGGWNLMVSKFSAKKKEAVDFAKFLLRQEAQEIIFTKGGFFPVIRSMYEEEGYRKKFPELIQISGMLAHGVHRPSHDKYTKFSDILARYISLAIRGRIGVEEALLQATKAIEAEKISL